MHKKTAPHHQELVQRSSRLTRGKKSPQIHRISTARPGHRVLKPAQLSPISQPSTQRGRSVSERVSESTQRRRALCAANRMCERGSCYIGVESYSQTTLPVLFVEGRVASKSSLVLERHPETEGDFLP